ncbi:hypothetical protein MBLNU13_g05875t1 [Cladosporium sp. NU13]
MDHLESIVSRLQQAQQAPEIKNQHAINHGHTDYHSPASDSFVAPDFWTELAESVAGLRSVLEDGESPDQNDNTQQSRLASQEPEITTSRPFKTGDPVSCDPNRMLFGQSNNFGPTNMTSEMNEFLLNVYHERIHALFNVLHWPSTLASFKVSKEKEDVKARALKSAIFFTSVCSLLDHELEGRREILDQYRQRAEEAFIDAGLLTTTSFMVLQAFVIYLAGLRACESSAAQWTLISVAVRLADAMGLRGAQSSHKLSVIDRELRCRLWFGIGVLDLQSAFDRGSRALLGSNDFTDWPTNSDNINITAHSLSQPVQQDLSTEFSFARMTFCAGICHRKLTELGESAAIGTLNPHLARQQQLATLADFESVVKKIQKQYGTAPTKIQAFTVSVAQESLVAMTLLFHRPLHKRGKNQEAYAHGQIDNTEILIMATEVLERSQLKRSWFQFAQWAWFKWVKWFALAVVLAELCTIRGSSADRAWNVAQQSFDDYATIVADTKSGLLWKPIAKLMQRARTTREAQTTKSQDIAPIPNSNHTIIQWRDSGLGDLEPRLDDQTSTSASKTNSGGDFATKTVTDVDMTWFHWDLLIEDIETGGLELDTDLFPVA